ncbi:MAG: hypothetical protein JW910_10950, partial [Anaerolineae bacterium]|nr:hypothetical protein [Anaerolineae bacterium]
MSPVSTPTSSSPDSADAPAILQAEALDEDACPVCGGYRVIGYDVPVDDPRFGKAYPCPNCADDQQQERAQRLRKLSNLDAHAGKTFADFVTDLDYLSDAQAQNLRIAKDLCTRYAAQPQGWLLLQGGFGSGKTHLAAAIANA